MRWRRVLLLALAVAAVPVAFMVEDFQVDRDFDRLYRFLGRARSHAIERLFLPTLSTVRYQTKIGAGRVVFGAGSGETSPFNVHLHGGDIALLPWLGRKRSVWVHCTGGITEGRNDDWARNAR